MAVACLLLLTGCASGNGLPTAMVCALLLILASHCRPFFPENRSVEFLLRALFLGEARRTYGHTTQSCATQAFRQNYTQSFDLSSVDLATAGAGFKITGQNAGDRFGRAVSGAGDFNGDGIGDILVSAPYYNTNAGRVYVLFGRSGTGLSDIDTATMTTTDGIVIDASSADRLARRNFTLSAAGDVNGDGFDDILMGSRDAYGSQGAVWVVFGKANPTNLTLTSLGSDGARFQDLGIIDRTYTGTALGDVNGDGIDDFAIGEYYGPSIGYGRATIVFGTTAGFSGTVDTSGIGGSSGFRIAGESTGDYTGPFLSRLGDLNGDGIDDVLLGAGPGANGSIGGAYVIYGASGTRSDIALNAIGSDGFELTGGGTRWGQGISGAGDFNGDGTIDFAVSSLGYASLAGRTAVLFGDVGALTLNAISSGQGITLNGPTTAIRSGYAIEMSGDVNGDGMNDLLISADRSAYNGANSGAVWMVFGQNGIAASGTTLTGYTGGTTGIRIDGPEGGAYLGREVALSDINGDGCADMIMGAAYRTGVDTTYVIYGGPR